jgi:hypothetical protein
MGACCDSKPFGKPCGDCAFDTGSPDLADPVAAHANHATDSEHAQRLAWAAQEANDKAEAGTFWHNAMVRDSYFRSNEAERAAPTSLISHALSGKPFSAAEYPGVAAWGDELSEEGVGPDFEDEMYDDDDDSDEEKKKCCCKLVRVDWNYYKKSINRGRIVLLVTVDWVPSVEFSTCDYTWHERSTKPYVVPPAEDPVPAGGTRVRVPAGPGGKLTPWWVDLSNIAQRLTYIGADRSKDWYSRITMAKEGQCKELLKRGPETYGTKDNPRASLADIPRTVQFKIHLASGKDCGGAATTIRLTQKIKGRGRHDQVWLPDNRSSTGAPVSGSLPGTPPAWGDPATPPGWSTTPHSSEAEYRKAKAAAAKAAKAAAKKKRGP